MSNSKSTTKTPEEALAILQTEFDTRAIAVDPADQWGGANGLGAEVWGGRDHDGAVYRVMPAFGELPAGCESRNGYAVSAITNPNTGEIVPIVAKFGFKVNELDQEKAKTDPDVLVRSFPRLLSFVIEAGAEAAAETVLELRRAVMSAAVEVEEDAASQRRSKYFPG